MAAAQPDGQTVRDVLLVALTFASGGIDAISYLGLGRVFTANMTGNLVLLGLALGRVQGLEALRAGTAFAGYAIGVLAGSRLLGRNQPTALWPRRVTRALAVEAVLLAALAGGWYLSGAQPVRPWLEVLIACSAAAMGIQSSAAARLAVPSVSTTYVTGTLTSVVSELALFGVPTNGWLIRACVVLALATGAALDAVLLLHAPLMAPLVPVVALAAIAATAARCFGIRAVSTR